MIEILFNNYYFGILICVASFFFARIICSKFKTPLANPLVFATIFIICFLKITGIPIEYFDKGGDVIIMCLAPATVVLAVGIYNKLDTLKKYFIPILAGTVVGSLVAVSSVYFMCKLIGIDQVIVDSILSKSVTTAIAVGITETRGGLAPLTSAAVFIAGATGAIFAPSLIKILRITDPVAAGLAIGTSSHALGTTKALEIGETEGAVSSIAICMAGVITVVICMFI